MGISVVAPIFNEEGNIEQLVRELKDVLLPLDPELEIVLVDDGSTDGSTELLLRLSSEDPSIRAFSLSRNFGQTAALSFGIQQARGEYVVTIDADLQNDPNDIPKMIGLLDAGYDLVTGWRRQRRDPALRSMLSKFANRIISRYSSVKIHDFGCTLKAYRTSKLSQLKLFGEMHRFIPIYMEDLGAKIIEVEVNHRERRWGSSKYGFNRIAKVIVDLMAVVFLRRYLARPMHIFGLIGLGLLSLSLTSVLVAVVLRLIGYASLIQTPLPLLGGVLFVGAINAWLLGLLAELLVRVFFKLEPSRAVDGRLL